MTEAKIRAQKLAKHFDWEIPSEQYNEVEKALREAEARGMEMAAKVCEALYLKGGPSWYVKDVAEHIRADAAKDSTT